MLDDHGEARLNVRHEQHSTVDFDGLRFRVPRRDWVPIDIAGHGGYWRQLAQVVKDGFIANVAGVQDVIHSLEQFGHLGIEATVRI